MKKIIAIILTLLCLSIMLVVCKKLDPPAPDPKPPITDPNDKDKEYDSNPILKNPEDANYNDPKSLHPDADRVGFTGKNYEKFLWKINNINVDKFLSDYDRPDLVGKIGEIINPIRKDGAILAPKYKGMWIEEFRSEMYVGSGVENGLEPNCSYAFNLGDIITTVYISYIEEEYKNLLKDGYDAYLKVRYPKEHRVDNYKETLDEKITSIYMEDINIGGKVYNCKVRTDKGFGGMKIDYIFDEKVITISITDGTEKQVKDLLKDLSVEYMSLDRYK